MLYNCHHLLSSLLEARSLFCSPTKVGTLARGGGKGEGGTSESESSSADIINYRSVAAQYQEALVVRVVMGLIGQDWCPFGKQDWQYLRLFRILCFGYNVSICSIF